MEYLSLAGRVLLGVTFAVASAGKVLGFRAFAADLARMRVLPRRWVTAAAVLTVTAEAAVAPLLIAGRTVPLGVALAALLLTAFGAVIVVLLRRGQAASCPCFGRAPTPLGVRHLARNGLLLIAAGLAVTGPAALSTAGVAGVVAAVAAGVFTASLVIRLDDLTALFAPAR
jgi:hypothetical protein